MSTTNHDRAHWAAEALSHFADTTGSTLPDEALHDLIANIGHYCDRMGIDYLTVAAAGIGVWQAERADPDGLAPEPHVTISITPPRRRPT